MFMKLTKIDRNRIFINPVFIVSINKSFDKGTRVCLPEGYVQAKETPEEILAMIKECEK